MSRKLLVFFLQFSGVPKVTTLALEAKHVSHGITLLRIINRSPQSAAFASGSHSSSFTMETCFALRLFLWQAPFC
jgi:hypothetical protein